MSYTQFITRIIELDVGHRVMHERVKCFSIHGHRVKIELTFSFTEQQDIGYCIDFKEIKRVGGQWLEDMFDHGFITNPVDSIVIKACEETNSKLYAMSLNGPDQYCNPTAENIAKEIFMAMEILFSEYSALSIHHVRYYETPNCWVDTYAQSIQEIEQKNFHTHRYAQIKEYAKNKGIMEYDSRKVVS